MKKGDADIEIIKDTSIALLTTAGLILTIAFGLITAIVSPSVLLQIRWPILASCVFLIVSIIAGVYLIRYLIGSPRLEKDDDKSKSPEGENAEPGKNHLNKARAYSKLQFLFFVFGVVALAISAGIRLFN